MIFETLGGYDKAKSFFDRISCEAGDMEGAAELLESRNVASDPEHSSFVYIHVQTYVTYT